jgi:large subunit ribosomal protein L15
LEVFNPGSEVTPQLLLEHGLIRRKDKAVKILGDGSLSKPLTIKAHGFSSKAKEKIEALGGKAELIRPYA